MTRLFRFYAMAYDAVLILHPQIAQMTQILILPCGTDFLDADDADSYFSTHQLFNASTKMQAEHSSTLLSELSERQSSVAQSTVLPSLRHRSTFSASFCEPCYAYTPQNHCPAVLILYPHHLRLKI